MKQILYYYQQPAGDFTPSLVRIYFNRVILSTHAPGFRSWGFEVSFKNAHLSFDRFFNPSLLPFRDKFNIWQFWKLGHLKGLTFRLGKRYIKLPLTKSEYARQLRAIETDALPADFYTVEKRKDRYQLFFKYYFDDSRRRVKLKLPQLIKTYDQPPNRREIYQQIMLNDEYRWRKADLNEGEKIEISEGVYYFLQNCMPPRHWIGNYFEVGEADHHNENGVAIHRACNYVNGKYYTGHPNTISRLRPKQTPPL